MNEFVEFKCERNLPPYSGPERNLPPRSGLERNLPPRSGLMSLAVGFNCVRTSAA
jgi:hypothetical protein